MKTQDWRKVLQEVRRQAARVAAAAHVQLPDVDGTWFDVQGAEPAVSTASVRPQEAWHQQQWLVAFEVLVGPQAWWRMRCQPSRHTQLRGAVQEADRRLHAQFLETPAEIRASAQQDDLLFFVPMNHDPVSALRFARCMQGWSTWQSGQCWRLCVAQTVCQLQGPLRLPWCRAGAPSWSSSGAPRSCRRTCKWAATRPRASTGTHPSCSTWSCRPHTGSRWRPAGARRPRPELLACACACACTSPAGLRAQSQSPVTKGSRWLLTTASGWRKPLRASAQAPKS